MDRAEAIRVLNRLLRILKWSLPVYLQDTRPWARRNAEEARQALARLAADQQEYVERITETIERLGGHVEPGGFPVQFTSLHDLGLDFLLQETIELHGRGLETIGQCVEALDEDLGLRALAEDVFENQRDHLRALRAMVEEKNGGVG
jgi:hypothetical protein